MQFHETSLMTEQFYMGFHVITVNIWWFPRNSKELWNIDINQFHNSGSVFHCCMISCYHISDNPLVVEIMRYHSYKATFLMPLIWLKWRYSILNGGLFWIKPIPFYLLVQLIYNAISAWISETELPTAITHLCPTFKGYLVKQPLK